MVWIILIYLERASVAYQTSGRVKHEAQGVLVPTVARPFESLSQKIRGLQRRTRTKTTRGELGGTQWTWRKGALLLCFPGF